MTSMVLEALLALAAVFSLLRLPFQWAQPEASHPAVLRSQPTFPSTAPDPLHLWHLPFPEVRNDTAGYPVLPPSVVSHTVLFTADASSAQYPGTFNHHPHVVAVNGSALLLLSFSNGLHDEDADGQQVLYAASQDAGASFSPLLPLFPPALLPGERPSYNVSTTSLQRALCSEGFVQLRDGRLYALAEAFGVSNVTGVAGEGVGFKATGYGRVARPLSPRDGSVAGPACWVQPSRFARALAGTPYDERRMAACDDRAELVALLSQAGTEPAWSWAALSDDHYIHASEAASQVQEPTFGVPFAGPSICRFWRLKSASTNRSLYVECAASADPRYNGWFNGTDEAGQGWYGPYSAIVPSDVPDSGSKEFLSTLPAPFTHVLISNTKPNGDRWPLTIATSTDAATFTAIAALHPTRPPRARYTGGTPGFQYPSATIVKGANGSASDALFVVYNVNKEDIWMSRVRLSDLPRASASTASAPTTLRPAPSPLPSAAPTYDLCVYAATPGGIAAAVSAVRFAASQALPPPSVLVLEPTFHIGGMSAAGGIGLRDLGVEDTIAHSIAHEWTMRAAAHYNVSYPVYQPWMNVSRALFQSLLAEANATVLLGAALSEQPDAVTKEGARIVAVQTVDGRTHSARVFVDASYEGDLLVRAGASHTFGRESAAQYGEPNAGVQKPSTFGDFLHSFPVLATVSTTNRTLLPLIDREPLAAVGSGDERVMAYSYRLCVTTNRAISVPFPRPPRYDASRYVLLQRYIDSLVASGQQPQGPPLGALVDIFPYRGFPPGDKFDLCDSADSAVTSDAVGLNAGFVRGTYSERARIAEAHREYLLGLLWFLGHSPSVPAHTRNSTLSYGLCSDTWPESDHVPPLMYIREAVRLLNDGVLTQVSMRRGECLADSIALGSWDYDVHLVSRTAVRASDTNDSLIARNEGQMVVGVAGNSSNKVYEIPYRAVLPRAAEVSNLLVPVNLASSHVTFSSLRVEPHWMLIGEACGVAAVIAVRDAVAVQAVDVSEVQAALSRRGVLVHYPTTKCPSPTGKRHAE